MDVVRIVLGAFGLAQEPVWRAYAFVDRKAADAMAEQEMVRLRDDPMPGSLPYWQSKIWIISALYFSNRAARRRPELSHQRLCP